MLEVGCGDGFGLPIVAKSVSSVVALDWDAKLIEDNKKRLNFIENASFVTHDFCRAPLSFESQFDATYQLDVIEHIEPSLEAAFMKNIIATLTDEAVCIIGTPNRDAEKYASSLSNIAHINLKDHKDLRALLDRYFKNVFLFSMNDEVVHTGFYPMAHYLFGLGVGVKR